MSPIDAVISWVDGYDPNFQKKLKDFCLEQGIDQDTVVEPTRIHQCNEINYCLHSLRRFAPWLRKIYIISNQQIPPIVSTLKGTVFGKKIQIIDQNDLLSQFQVPSPAFNSITLEWLIWHIKGLSDKFIYLNDDFFILREVSPEAFFQNDCIVVRGEWKTQSEQKILSRLKKYFFASAHDGIKTNPHRAWQEKSARIAGWQKHFYFLAHAPYSLSKPTFQQFMEQNQALLLENLHYPFRSPSQTSSVPLMTHLAIKQNRVVYDQKYQAVMVNPVCHPIKKIKKRLQYAMKAPHIAFLCMQSLDRAPSGTRELLLDWLQKHIIN